MNPASERSETMEFKTLPPLKSLGQNFLRNPATARRIVEQIPLKADRAVVELGAGQGAITFLLADKAATVLALEIDTGLAARLQEKVLQSGRNNIQVIHEDLLKIDWQNWFDLLRGPFFLVGNLPYHISTPVLFKIIDHREIVESAYVMLQKEVADRLSGKPGQKTYGLLTVLIGYYAEVKPLLTLGPGSFFPKPKVASTFVQIRLRDQLNPPLENEEVFQWTVRSAFGQRRKQLKNALAADGRFPEEWIREALTENQIDPRSRGETLSIPRFVHLANTLNRIKLEEG
jgi:16S rRNA (adenine1518-N6/adenine1519-N6)-dimethyltransferase